MDHAPQERASFRERKLCCAFIGGSCTFGDSCRYSHDTESYLAEKPADLPGVCPFALLPQCPFGVACRYLGAHGRGAAAALPLAPSTENAESASAHSAQLTATLPLPAPGSIQAELNPLDKTLQGALRRNAQPFPKADAVLRKLSIRIAFKPPAGGAAADERSEEGAEAGGSAGDGLAAASPAAEDLKDCVNGQAPAKRPRTCAAPGPGEATGAAGTRVRPEEKRTVDFKGKLYLAPLTTASLSQMLAPPLAGPSPTECEPLHRLATSRFAGSARPSARM